MGIVGLDGLCKGVLRLDAMKLSHERIVADMKLNITELYLTRQSLKHHVQELELSRKHLYSCIMIISAFAAVVILTLAILAVYLLGVREETRRRLEAQRYEGVIQELKHRIKELELQKAQDDQQQQHQQHFVYAMPQATPPQLRSIP